MKKDQLIFVMSLLGITAINKQEAIKCVILNGDSAYSCEIFYSIPKNTLKRDCLKCNQKWDECMDVFEFVKKSISE